jgi:MFS family permease
MYHFCLLISGGIFFLTIYLKIKLKANNFQIFSYFLITSYFSIYTFYIVSQPFLRNLHFFDRFLMTNEEINSFISIFGLSFAFFQIFGGFIMDKFNFKGSSFMIIIGSILIYGQNFIQHKDLLIILRFFIGLFLSINGVIHLFYSSKFWKKEQTNFVLNSIIFCSIKIASILLLFLLKYQNIFSWKNFFTTTSFSMIGISIIIFLFFEFFEQKHLNNEQKKEIAFKDLSKSFFQVILSDWRVSSLAVFSSFVAMNFFYIRSSGNFVDFSRDFFPNINENFANNLLNISSAYFILMTSFFVSFINLELLIFCISLISFCSSIILIFFAQKFFIAFVIGILGISLEAAAQMIPFYIIERDYKNNKALSAIFGFVNFFAMLFGVFGGQKLGNYFIQNSVKNAVKITGEKHLFLSGANVLFVFKSLFFSVAISFLISFFLWRTKKRKF